MTERAPWWWLREEADALGLGRGAERTTAGIVFGDASAKVRLEVVPRDEAAPLRLGPISVRVWGGDTSDPAVVALLRQIGRALHARREPTFRVEDAPVVDRPAGSTLIEVPSVCARACDFCGISRVAIAERRARGDDGVVDAAIEGATAPILFTGDDAASHPRIEEWVQRAASRHRVSLVGPPRRGRELALAPRLARAGLARWSSGIFGVTARAHDQVAGEDGAWRALRGACEAYRAVGIEVELIAPLTRTVVSELVAIAALGRAWSGRPVIAQLYVPDPSVGTALDDVVAPFAAVREALRSAAPEDVSIEGVPPCVVPVARRAAMRMLDRSETIATAHPEVPCGACALRGGCPGLALTSLRAVGTEGLGEL